jgi:hypothetical protein
MQGWTVVLTNQGFQQQSTAWQWQTRLPSPSSHLVIEIEDGIIAVLARQDHWPGAVAPPQQRALRKQRHSLGAVLAVAAAGEGVGRAGRRQMSSKPPASQGKRSHSCSRHGRLRKELPSYTLALHLSNLLQQPHSLELDVSIALVLASGGLHSMHACMVSATHGRASGALALQASQPAPAAAVSRLDSRPPHSHCSRRCPWWW